MKCEISSASCYSKEGIEEKYSLSLSTEKMPYEYKTYDDQCVKTEHDVHVMNLDSKEDIVNLVSKVGRIVVDESEYPECDYHITIYDDYLE